MKKLILALLAGVTSLVAIGQERTMFTSFPSQEKIISYQSLKQMRNARSGENSAAAKTTAAARWYSFSDYFDSSETGGFGAGVITGYMWKDTAAVMAYSDGSSIIWQHNRNVSVGLVTDPSFAGFNSVSYYNGEMEITPTNAYTVDSVRFSGIYGFNPANTYVDTIRVAFVYGDGSRGNGTTGPDVYLAKTGNPVVLSKYGETDSMSTYRMHFDTLNVRTTGTTVIVRDLILDNTGSTPAWGDTLFNGFFIGTVGFPGVNVPAGNLIGATLTFISGSPTFMVDDTVFGSTVGYKHNMFRPSSIFRGGFSATAPTPVDAAYSINNRNSGMYKTLPDTANKWGGQYIPLWFWSATGGGASTNQYPDIDFHVNCDACGVVHVGVNDVHKVIDAGAYPNPATEELNIPFTITGIGEVTVTLGNMMGQTIAVRNFKNVERGRAVFSTAVLPPGIYVYIVAANGQRITGKVAVAH